MIRAECQTDDDVILVRFNAKRWFDTASDDDIVTLASSGWQNTRTSPQIVNAIRPHSSNVGLIFDYVGLMAWHHKEVGFECRIQPDDAMTWIEDNRPHLLPAIGMVEAEPAPLL